VGRKPNPITSIVVVCNKDRKMGRKGGEAATNQGKRRKLGVYVVLCCAVERNL